MPQNTPTIYLVVGLLALVGALVGALGQIGTAALQRRHDRRLKLADVRREAYTELLLVVEAVPGMWKREKALEDELAEAEAREEGTVTREEIDEIESELEEVRQESVEMKDRLNRHATTVMLVAGKSVRHEMVDLLRQLTNEGVTSLDSGAFTAAARRELGPV